MKYKEQLLEFIFNDDLEEDAMMNWVASMPLLEQPDILREFEELIRELAAAEGRDIEAEFPEINNLQSSIELYEDKILDEKLAEANLVMAQQELDKSVLKIDQTFEGIRNYVMDCIVNNENNAEDMKELAKKMMQNEKDNGMYDPNNWSRIL
jgi:hypothetical protein